MQRRNIAALGASIGTVCNHTHISRANHCQEPCHLLSKFYFFEGTQLGFWGMPRVVAPLASAQ